MTHHLHIDLGDRDDLTWAQRIVTKYHYLRSPVDPRARPMAYIIHHDANPVLPMGLIMLGIPHATRCRGWSTAHVQRLRTPSMLTAGS